MIKHVAQIERELIVPHLLGYVIGDFKETMSSSSLGMDGSFWDAFASEMSHLVHEVEILHEKWTTRADRE